MAHFAFAGYQPLCSANTAEFLALPVQLHLPKGGGYFYYMKELRELRKNLQQERGRNVSATLAAAVYQVFSVSERD